VSLEEVFSYKMKENVMTTNRKAAIGIGILFILATFMGVLMAGMIGPIIENENYLTDMYKNAFIVQISTLFNLVMASAVVGIAVLIYPILKRENHTLAIGYLSARIVEGTVLVIASVAWLLLVSLGAQFVQAGQPDGSYFQTLGDLLVNMSDMIFMFGAGIAFSISAIILNYVFMQSRIIPKFISIWGLIAALLFLILNVMKIMGMSVLFAEVAFTIPIALNEMVLAFWLIFKGFNTPIEEVLSYEIKEK